MAHSVLRTKLNFWLIFGLHKTKPVVTFRVMAPPSPSGPSWDRLFEYALGQEGLFTTKQAAEAGYSPQLLQKYLHNGRISRVRRSVYRIVHFPAAEHEDLAMLWLWSDHAGVFSHETALMLHDLSDVLPRKVYLTLPLEWQLKRLRVPKGVVLHYADLSQGERAVLGAIPVTNVRRTLLDCARSHVSPELVKAAVRQARARGLVDPVAVKAIRKLERAS